MRFTMTRALNGAASVKILSPSSPFGAASVDE
jgi:hypothetical protein